MSVQISDERAEIDAEVEEIKGEMEQAAQDAADAKEAAAEASSKADAAADKADSYQSQIDDVTATVNGVEQEVAGFSSQIQGAVEDASQALSAATEASQDLEGFKTTVSQTYETKSDADAAMAQEVLDRNSAIEQSAGEILSTVSQNYVDNETGETLATKAEVSQTASQIKQEVSEEYQVKGDYLTEDEAASSYASKSELTQTVDSIKAEVAQDYQTKAGMSDYATNSSVEQTASEIESNVAATYQTKDGMSSYATNSSVTQTANSIKQEVAAEYQVKGDYATNSGVAATYATKTSLQQTEDSILSSVESEYQSKDGMSSYYTKTQIDQKDDAIELSVSAAQSTADKAALYSLRKSTVDLSNLNQDTYYPVTGTMIPYEGYKTFRCDVQLNSGTKPSWSTHKSGFTVNLSARMKAFGWGTVSEQLGWIDDCSYYYAESMPASIFQMTNSSTPVFYLRGGGKYFLYTDYACTWTVRASTFTSSSQSVSPVASLPANWDRLVNQYDDHEALASLSVDVDGITGTVSDLSGRVSTVEQTAEGLEVTLASTTTTANNALSKANSAASAASTAQSTASSAATAAAAANKVFYANSTTAAATKAKTATVSGSGFALVVGVTVSVRFQYANTANSPTLNVNSTGAKPIVSNGTATPTANLTWNAAWATVTFVYDGSQWRISGDNSIVKANSAQSTANTANITANAAKTAASNAQTTANTANSTANAAKTAAANAQTTATNAAKTATNYLKFDNAGLCVGNQTTTLGYNTLIKSTGVDIRNGSTVLSSFGASQIELGRNSSSSKISFCGGKGEISYKSKTAAGVSSNMFTIESDSKIYIGDGSTKVYMNGYTVPQGIMQSASGLGGGTWTTFKVGNGASVAFGIAKMAFGSGSDISVGQLLCTLPRPFNTYAVNATLRNDSIVQGYDGAWDVNVLVRYISSTQFMLQVMRGNYAFIPPGAIYNIGVIVFGFTSNDY